MDSEINQRMNESKMALSALEAQKQETDEELSKLRMEVDLNLMRVARLR